MRHVCSLRGYDIKIYDIEYDTNNFSVCELLQDPRACKPGKLVKIITNTVMNAEQLYNKFKYDSLAYKYAGVSQYFNIVTQIMFELIIKKNTTRHIKNLPIEYSVPKTTMCWFDTIIVINLSYPYIWSSLLDPIL